MYARSYGDEENIQTFRRGQYSIPANYAGNAFTADEEPDIRENSSENTAADNTGPESVINPCETCGAEPLKREPLPETVCPCAAQPHEKHAECDTREKERSGLLGGILSRFERGFELDDWLLIGLIILLVNGDKKGCDDSRGEIIILLALLLLLGF